jgi:hypothetical protein
MTRRPRVIKSKPKSSKTLDRHEAYPKTLLTKADFARRHGRTPAAVSRWISQRKLSEAAVVGEGPRAQIWVEQAEIDLALSLDAGRQQARGKPVILGMPGAKLGIDEQRVSLRATNVAAREYDLARRAKADADIAEQEAIAARRKNDAEHGRWIEAEVAAREWARELRKLIARIDAFVGVRLARSTADKFGIDYREVAEVINRSWRE